MSLDGFVAGPNPTHEEPLGEGGERLHDWAFATEAWREQHGLSGGDRSADSDLMRRMLEGNGAYVMGRRMFDGGEGPLDESWRGWWGDEPPYHAPVFVVTHHERAPVEMEGGTTFHFVTDGIESALDRARDAAGGADVAIAGGADVIRQCMAAGRLDEIFLHIAPITLGGGTLLFERVGARTLEPVEVVASPAATHIRYRVGG